MRTEALACAVAVAHLMSPDMRTVISIRIMEETGPLFMALVTQIMGYLSQWPL